MVAARLRDVMLRAVGAGSLAGEGVAVGAAEHPVCGDRIELSVRFVAGNVAELRWRAHGCPAAMAVAALAGATLPGAPVADVGARLAAALAAHGGRAAHERHAEALLLRAFAAAAGGR